jgi:osmotically-inducible protein OsmY
MESDAIIRQLVTEELDGDPSVTADGIGVAVKNGVVTLSGHVPSYFEQAVAVRSAQRIRGVKAVAQDLGVRLPQGKKRNDDEIAARALAILDWSLHGAGDITVTVDDGWVTLAGQVDWGFQKQDAEHAIRRLGGVTGVSNTITVRPRVDAGEIQKNIQRAFQRNAELEGSAISIAVDGSTVTLSGQVKAWFEKRVAQESAWSAPGVTEVRDRISIA